MNPPPAVSEEVAQESRAAATLGQVRGYGKAAPKADQLKPSPPLPPRAPTDAMGALLGAMERQTEAIAALVALSRDEDEEVRSWATFGLASQCEVDTDAVRQALVDRFDEEDVEVRGEALVGLARRGDPRVIEPLATELRGETVGVLAVEAASLMPSRRFVDALEALAKVEPDDALLTEALERCRKAR